MFIVRLQDIPHWSSFLKRIYVQEWLDHYQQEWDGVNTIEEDLALNQSTIYLLFDNRYHFVGTVAVLDQDMKDSPHSPWLTCLYVEPSRRNFGYARMLVNHVLQQTDIPRPLYLWCHEKNKGLYEHLGWSLVKQTEDHRWLFVHP